MSDDNLYQQIENLFIETGEAHHKAFIKTDGADPEWPLWYSEHLKEKLGRLLNAKFTRSELVYLLITAEREMALMAPGAGWAKYYATFFIERYL